MAATTPSIGHTRLPSSLMAVHGNDLIVPRTKQRQRAERTNKRERDVINVRKRANKNGMRKGRGGHSIGNR